MVFFLKLLFERVEEVVKKSCFGGRTKRRRETQKLEGKKKSSLT